VTRREALKILRKHKDGQIPPMLCKAFQEALSMAIAALRDGKKR
jgi:HD-GYP domain-containing protein (c-di-GMP phosphodiesterase class II)